MIFSLADHVEQIKAGTKTQTRRPSDRYRIDRFYAVQPGRGKHGIPEGKIYIETKTREWKPDLEDLPKAARFARSWRMIEAGYPINQYNAHYEGGYTPMEFEKLYEKMYPGWTERWAYTFKFYTARELAELGEVI